MSLNDKAWETLFDRHNILDEIQRNGFYEIEASTIKKVREPRLMAKFDHWVNQPDIFKENDISILPVSRSKYVLGNFNAYNKVKYNKSLRPTEMYLPDNILSINRDNLYSESAALHAAYVTGMISDVLGEECIPTVSGRMGSQVFDFSIKTHRGSDFGVQIKNAQLEIDGGYESDNAFTIVEAKNESVEDFLVRQLYYPYRLWQSKIQKQVIPTFFTLSNDVFSFFVFKFEDPSRYNSLKLVEQKDYIIAHEPITLDDIVELLHTIMIVREPEIAFPQADSFSRIVDFLALLVDGPKTKENLITTTTFNVVDRQIAYYTTAARYLGLAESYRDVNAGPSYRLTAKGLSIMKMSYKRKYLSLAACILEHKVFQQVLNEQLMNGGNQIGKPRIMELMKNANLYNIDSDKTYFRRAGTIQAWVDWILSLQDEF